jgi:tetratricopeptide (TPR) repeat protein
MVSRKLISGALLLSSAATFSGCTLSKMIKMAKDQQLTVTPSPLELHGDSVKFEASALLPLKMLKANKVYTVYPTYNYADQKVALGDLQFKASDYPNAKTEQPKVTKKLAFAYTGEAMNKGDVTVKGTASDLNGKSKTTPVPDMSIAKGLITTSRLVQDAYYPSYADHGYNNAEELTPTNVAFFFEQGSSKLRVVETGGKRGKFLDAFIAGKNVTRTVTVTGTHSPEGREAKNVSLAEERASAIEKYYRGRLKKFDYGKKADSIDFVTKSIVQDWTAFKDTLAIYKGITEEEKSAILAVIDGGAGDFVAKEAELTKLPTYKKLMKDVYPKLRTARTEILTVLPKKSDAQISVLAKNITDGKAEAKILTDKELAYAATLTPILSEKEAIYLAATKANDSWASHNNLGAVYLEYAKKAASPAERTQFIDKAVTHFDIAKNKQEAAEVFANLGAAQLMKGNTSAAQQSFDKAMQLSPSDVTRKAVNSMAGVLQVKKAQYQSAISSFTNGLNDAVVSYNKGLAQLLNKDFDNAYASFDEAIKANPQYALAYYGAAVTAARQNKEDGVAANLAKAISLDANLRARVINDLEFAKFSTTQRFKDAIR